MRFVKVEKTFYDHFLFNTVNTLFISRDKVNLPILFEKNSSSVFLISDKFGSSKHDGMLSKL